MSKRNVLSVLLTAGMVLGLLGGCSNKENSSEKKSTSDNGRTKITWMAILQNPTPPSDVVVNKLDKYSNVDLTFNWMPAANYEEKLTTSLASGELADIVTVAKMGNSTVRSSQKNGVFWDITPYLKDYKNLKDIPESLLDSVKVDGKIYGVPIQKQLSRSGFAIRKDWLDKLGLEVPTTMDELYKVAKAFTEDDPDGNGKNDTVGIVDRGFNDINFTSFKQFVTYYGGANGWGIDKDGNFYHQATTKAYKKAMKYYKKLYDNGYINKDFAVTQKADQGAQFSQGRFGIYPGAGMSAMAGFETTAKSVGQDMDLVGVNKISADGTKNYHTWAEGNGLGGLLAFPKSEVKTKKRLKELLTFVDSLLDKKPYYLMTYGIEGIHYDINDAGELTQTDMDKFATDVQALGSSRPSVTKYLVKSSNEKTQESDRLVKENEKYAVTSPSVGLDSATFNQVGSEIDKLLVDATVQYIMGQIDIKGFDDAVQQWKDQGGTKIGKEYKASYEKNQKSK